MGRLFWALLILKAQLLRNQTRLGEGLALALLAVGGVLWMGISVGAGTFCYMAAVSTAPKNPAALLVVFDAGVCGFLFFSIFSLLTDLQRGEAIDFKKMMHFPVSLAGVFLLNFGASLFSPMSILFTSVMTGVIAGLYIRYGVALAWAVALSVGFFLMQSACLYSFRGWIASLMVGKRRRAWIVSVFTLIFVLLAQLPNLLVVGMHHGVLEQLEQGEMQYWLQQGNLVFPPFWLALGAWRLVQGDWQTAAKCAGGLFALAMVVLALGFRNTLRTYQGRSSRGKAPVVVARSTRLPWTLRRLPLCSEETSAIAMAYFLTLTRHTQLRMALVMPFLFAGAVAIVPRWLPKGALSAFPPDTFLALMLFATIIGFLAYQTNIFGVDAGGFLRLSLLSTPRRNILLGANLALSSLVVATSFSMLGILFALSDFPARRLGMAAAGLLFVQLAFCTAGNLCSIYFPVRMEAESMRRQAYQWMMALRVFVGELFLGLVVAPVGLCFFLDAMAQAKWGPDAFPAGLAAELGLVAVMALIYGLTLSGVGDLLLSREQRILESLARKRE